MGTLGRDGRGRAKPGAPPVPSVTNTPCRVWGYGWKDGPGERACGPLLARLILSPTHGDPLHRTVGGDRPVVLGQTSPCSTSTDGFDDILASRQILTKAKRICGGPS